MPAIGRDAAKALRRTHRKSRMGCAFCRRRRIKAGRKCALNTQLTIIKCDERKPACANCTRRDVPCEYSNDAVEPRQLQRSSSTTPVEVYSSETPNGQDASSSNGIQTTTATSGQSLAHDSSLNSGTLNITDLELLHAWENSTAPSLAKFVSSLDGVVTLWQKTVPEIGFDYPFVLHACLAISATHLSRFKRGRADFYRSASERHWSQAFSAVTAQIPSASDASYHAFFTFSMLSCMYKLAKGPQPGDYLAFGAHDSDGEGSEWHTYYKGFHSFLELGLDALRVGPLGQLFDITQRKTRKFWLPEAPPDADAVADLRRLCGEVVEEERPEFGVYTTAIDNLARVFAVVYAEQREGEYGIFVWILNIKEELIVCIQQREPMALVIFAYFVVLLEELPGWWILEGWVHHVLGGIYDALPVGARAWISWPMAQTGWLPP